MNFRKLVSNLPFNPSLISQVAFYGRRAKQESSIRRAGFVMIALAMLVQMIAVMAPPQVSLASSDRNMIQGSFAPTKDGILAKYDASPFVQAAYRQFGIGRDDILKMQPNAIDKAQDRINGVRRLVTAGRGANGSVGEYSVAINSTEYNAPIFIHNIDSSYPSLNFVPVLFCPRETCGAIKMIILACGNPVMDLNEPKPTPEPAPQGTVDFKDCNIITGWAFNNKYARYVQFYVDRAAFTGAVAGKDYFEVEANQSRPDVTPVTGTPAVGFVWNGGPLRNDGRGHQLWVYVSDHSTHNKLLNGGEGVAVNFNCPKPPAPTCPVGQIGTPPNCSSPSCPTGQVGTPPNCAVPKCAIPGKQNLPLDDANCHEAVATCDLLQTAGDKFQVKTAVAFTARASVQYGATINSYNLDFGDNNAKLTNFATSADIRHTYTKTGDYTVKLYAETSLGQKTSAACEKKITITPEPVPCTYDAKLTKDDAKCRPCVENPLVSETDKTCVTKIVKQKKVANPTQSSGNFDGKTAKPGDTLVYTLVTTNVANKLTEKNFVVEESIIDILDYADVTDYHGGTLDAATKVVRWPAKDIKAGAAIENTITVKVKSVIPATPNSTSDAGTYDLKMVNTYGTTVTVNIPCTGPKCVETAVTSIPNTGPGTSAALGFVITAIVGYFFARSRLLARELELIKQEYAPTGGF